MINVTVKSFNFDSLVVHIDGSPVPHRIGPLGFTVEAHVFIPDKAIAIDGKFTFVADRERELSLESIEDDIRKLFVEGGER